MVIVDCRERHESSVEPAHEASFECRYRGKLWHLLLKSSHITLSDSKCDKCYSHGRVNFAP